MILGLILPANVLADKTESPILQADPLTKVEQLVLNELALESQTDYFIWMAEKADLSPAYQLKTQAEKGQFVFDILVATAERTQADLRAFLDNQGVDYQAFYIANKILVRGGDMSLLVAVASRADVAQVTANHPFQLEEPFRTPYGPDAPAGIETNVLFINADDVWALGYTGQGTVMAGNDTGLDETHPAIARHYRGCVDPPACTTYNHNYNWWDATDTYPTDPFDGHGHGTHTAGTMVGDDGGANQIGVAPGAQTVHCKNMTNSGSGSDATFTECFQWDLAPWDLTGLNPNPALAPDAINNSWGYSGGNQNQFRDEIQALHAAGVLVEVSSGNEGASCATLRSPGDYNEVLTTGSIQHTAPYPGTVTGFSSRGPSDLDPSPANYFPDIMAPGENIRSSVPGGLYEGGWSGTSMAGPHATALVGLMWSACPVLQGDVTMTLQLIHDTATPITGYVGSCGGDYVTGPNNDWGFGTIDALAAVQAAIVQCSGMGFLAGTVTDTGASPIADATVTATGPYPGTDITDVSGYYSMTLVAGTYNVLVEHPQYVDGIANNVVVVTDTLTTQNFQLVERGRLYGQVTDADNNFPLVGATVTASDGTFDITDASGNYEMYLDPGNYNVTATMLDYAPVTTPVVIVSGADILQNFALLAAISVIPDPLEVSVVLGNVTTLDALLVNNLPTAYPFEFLEIPGGMALSGGTEDSGGPDPYGYVWADSNEPGATIYEWVDATGGTALNLTDDSEANVTLPFTFNFYGVTSSNIRVGNNGGIFFNATTGDLSTLNANLGSTTTNNLIVPFWDDIDADTGNVYYQTFGVAPHRMFVIEWFDRPHYSNIGDATFELILYEGTNNIKYQYQDVVFGNALYDYGVSATAGIRGFLPNYLQRSYNQAVIEDLYAICFTYPGSPPCDGGDITWFATSILSGTVPANSSLGWTNTFSATTAAGVTQPGDYTGELLVLAGNPGDPNKYIPVIMHVLPTGTLGLLDGTVTSDRPGGPLEALIEVEDSFGAVVTMTTDALTGYYSHYFESGTLTVTASAPGYLSQQAMVSLPPSGYTQNFTLVRDAPEIVVTPPSLEATLTFGDSTMQLLNIANTGEQPLTFDIGERNGDYFPSVNEILLMAEDILPADWDIYRTALTAAGVSWDEWDLETQPFPTAADLAPYSVLLWVDESSMTPGDAPCQVIADWLVSGDKALFVASVDFIWDLQNGTPGLGEHNLYLLLNTTYVGDYAGSGITTLEGVSGDDIGGDFAPPNQVTLAGSSDSNGDYASVSSVATTGLIWGPGGTGSGNAALTHYEAANYKTVWLGMNFHNGLTDQAQRDLLMTNIMAFLYGGDVVWLTESPITGTVPVSGDTDINVTFDSSLVSSPGIYTAELRVSNNDPYNSPVTVPVTMTVEPSGDLGLLEGTITGLGYCDGESYPLEAEVFIEDSTGMTWTLTSDVNGGYAQWLYAGTYTVTVTAPEHVGVTTTAIIIGQQTTTLDVALRWSVACVDTQPDAYEVTLVLGQGTSELLNLYNNGAASTPYNLTELNQGYTPGLLGSVVPNDPIPNAEVAPTSRQYSQPLALGDDLFQIDAGVTTGSLVLLGVEVANGSYFVTAAGISSNTEPNVLFELDMSGNVLNQWTLTSAEPWGLRDLAFDGQYLYASDESGLIMQIDPSTGQFTGVTIDCPLAVCRALAYDPATDHFWSANWDTVIYEIDRTGAVVNSFPAVGLSTYGMAWDAYSPGGPYLWLWSQDGTPLDQASQLDPTTGALTGVSFAGYNDPSWVDNLAGGATISPDVIPGQLVFIGLHQADSDMIIGYDMDVVMDLDIPWLSEDPITGTIDADGSAVVDLIFDTTVLTQTGDYSGTLFVQTEDPVNPSIGIPILLHVITLDYGLDLEPETSAMTGAPGEIVEYTLQLQNTATLTDTIELTYTNVEPGWVVSLPVSSYDLAPGEMVDVIVLVTIPLGAMDGDFDAFTLTATSVNDPTVFDDVEITTTAVFDGYFTYLPFLWK